MKKNSYYPIIDVFAGPGGLGEGFCSLTNNHNETVFESILSFERDVNAHNTLLLRHFFRNFEYERLPQEYYDYLSGDIEKTTLFKYFNAEAVNASQSAVLFELNHKNRVKASLLVKERLLNRKKWVLVGGPPCQAYSLIGRSRRKQDPLFAEDEKHLLYQEYLHLISENKPPVFVMENVKGLLSAKHENEPMMHRILEDLRHPDRSLDGRSNGLEYKLYSFTESGEMSENVSPYLFLVKAEEYGIPQARHRIFILGIRADINVLPSTLQKKDPVTVKEAIGNMPEIRSAISREPDNRARWLQAVHAINLNQIKKELPENIYIPVIDRLCNVIKRMDLAPESPFSQQLPDYRGHCFCSNLSDSRLKKLTLHESRGHMQTDLHRYLFSAVFADTYGKSPVLADFPASLLPNHKNVALGVQGKMFNDRFRVQIANNFSTTVTSHISKDGHYFIHYDPFQCRSLSVREVARLQTFPDNYFFEGPRTQQYHQVGNAVPPLLAKQLAAIVADVLDQIKDDV